MKLNIQENNKLIEFWENFGRVSPYKIMVFLQNVWKNTPHGLLGMFFEDSTVGIFSQRLDSRTRTIFKTKNSSDRDAARIN